MDKKIAGLLGAAAALVTVGGANAAGVQGDPGLTYRDLLNPVPNATEALKADDTQRGSTPGEATRVAQVTIGFGHHHHHHHHHHARARVRVPFVPRHHHHHHHHHHHSMYYGR